MKTENLFWVVTGFNWLAVQVNSLSTLSMAAEWTPLTLVNRILSGGETILQIQYVVGIEVLPWVYNYSICMYHKLKVAFELYSILLAVAIGHN